MEMTIDDKIDHLKTLRNVWEVELRHSFNTTEKEINQGIVDSLDSAIETMRKYQKIEQIVTNILNNTAKEDERYVYDYLGGIIEVVEDENDR